MSSSLIDEGNRVEANDFPPPPPPPPPPSGFEAQHREKRRRMMEDPRDLNSKNSTKNKNAKERKKKTKTNLRVEAEWNKRSGGREARGGDGMAIGGGAMKGGRVEMVTSGGENVISGVVMERVDGGMDRTDGGTARGDVGIEKVGKMELLGGRKSKWEKEDEIAKFAGDLTVKYFPSEVERSKEISKPISILKREKRGRLLRRRQPKRRRRREKRQPRRHLPKQQQQQREMPDQHRQMHYRQVSYSNSHSPRLKSLPHSNSSSFRFIDSDPQNGNWDLSRATKHGYSHAFDKDGGSGGWRTGESKDRDERNVRVDSVYERVQFIAKGTGRTNLRVRNYTLSDNSLTINPEKMRDQYSFTDRGRQTARANISLPALNLKRRDSISDFNNIAHSNNQINVTVEFNEKSDNDSYAPPPLRFRRQFGGETRGHVTLDRHGTCPISLHHAQIAIEQCMASIRAPPRQDLVLVVGSADENFFRNFCK